MMRFGDGPELDLVDPADMEEELRERSEKIGAARDAAYERGYEDADESLDRDACARAIGYPPRLEQDYKDGWDNALAGVS